MAGDKISDIVSYYSIINDNGDTCYHDSLDGYLLVDGEILQLTNADGSQKEVQIKLHSTTSLDVTKFGGEFHGFKHAENSKVSLFYREDGTPEFLRFLDNVTIKRINKPMGEKVNDI
jgi:hypothetical protein